MHTISWKQKAVEGCQPTAIPMPIQRHYINFRIPVLNPRVAKLEECSGQGQVGGTALTTIWRLNPYSTWQ